MADDGQRGRSLGRTRRQFREQLQAESWAFFQGAGNLLDKACAALDTGDDERAERLMARAAGLPYSYFEECWPGVAMASVALYTEVNEAYEDSDEEDSEWLLAAIDVLPSLEGPGHEAMSSVLYGFILEGAVLEPREERLIRKQVGEQPLDVDHVDADATLEERVAVVRSLLTAWLVYHRRFWHRA